MMINGMFLCEKEKGGAGRRGRQAEKTTQKHLESLDEKYMKALFTKATLLKG